MTRLPAAICVLLLPTFTALAPAAGLPPDETVRQFKPAAGLQVSLCAAEPAVRQPVNVNFDARGRMWVVQYLQYPKPAGLKPIRVDPYLRTTFDAVPEPPPKGVPGADRITIFDDPDEHGHYRKSKDFVAGLNIATSVEFGHGGAWVLNPPYLLFYPDADGDDVPDGPPRVVLSGFGLEDTHAVASHLSWGPDGWLYGCQGSTCTAHVRGQSFQQAAWRYHPATDRFEVFSEGGGNTFGLEWDEHGDLLTGTNFSRFVMVHYVQGGYFIKGWTKHGPLHNPYAYGFFDHVPHTNFRGGHVTQLGVIYQGGALPEQFNGKWIAPNILANTIDVHTVTPAGSTFTTEYAGEFLGSGDTSFRPVDIRTGPDGAIYVADWYDRRANHVIPEDTWDKETGRVYRIAPPGLAIAKPFDLTKQSSAELVGLLSNPNDWYARTARRVLADRRDASVVPALKKLVRENDGRLALQAVWALYVSGGLDDTTAAELLGHKNADVRAWTVRLLADENQIVPSMRQPLVDLAKTDPSPAVRSQLACSARRLPAADALPILRELAQRAEDADDRYLPLLIWWAFEAHAGHDTAAVVAAFDAPALWQSPIVRNHLLERLGRRLAAERRADHFDAAAKLLVAAPDDETRAKVMVGLELALEGGGAVQPMPKALVDAVKRTADGKGANPLAARLLLRLGAPDAERAVVKLVADKATPAADRAALLRALGDAGSPAVAVPVLLDRFGATEPKEVRGAALSALTHFDDARIAPAVLAVYPKLPNDARAAAAAVLAGRPASAKALLAAVAAGTVAPDQVPPAQARRMLALRDPELTAGVAKLWGGLMPASDQERAASMSRVRGILAAGAPGQAAPGGEVFAKACAACHAFRGKGARIGPDLTGYDRRNLDYLVTNIVDPSAVIRDEYATFNVRTTDGETLNGAVTESEASVTVDDGTTKTVVPRGRVAKVEPSPVSRMPEKLLDGLTDEQVRDLFTYLVSEAP